MKRVILDLSKGLNLNQSDLAAPFNITRLPFWPKPGGGFVSHPGHDLTDAPIDANGEILHSDQAGNIVVRAGSALKLYDLPGGRIAAGEYRDGVYIPNTGWISEHTREPILFGSPAISGVNLLPLEIVSGSLGGGSYIIYALTFYRMPTGLYFAWYASAATQITGTGKGLKVKLGEEPGGNRVVRLYVQRAEPGASYTPMTFLAELREAETEFTYASHLQEQEAVSFAIPRPRKKFATYYNGRYFYQADRLSIIGAGSKVNDAVGGTPIADPTGGLAVYYKTDGIATISPTIGATPQIIPVWAGLDVYLPINGWSEGLYTVRYGGNTWVFYHKDWKVFGLAYKHSGEVMYNAAAKSPSRIVFVGNGGNILTAPLDDYQNPNAWLRPTSPTGNDIKDVVWAGNQFAAIANRQLLLSTTGESWSLQAPPASLEPNFTEWDNLVYAGGKIFIYARQILGPTEWYSRIFIYSNGGWNVHDPKPRNVNGMVIRRTGFLTVDSSGNLLLVQGLKAGTYWDASLPVPVDILEQDHYVLFNPSNMGFLREWWENRGTGETALYGRLIQKAVGGGVLWDGTTITTLYYGVGRRQVGHPSARGVYGDGMGGTDVIVVLGGGATNIESPAGVYRSIQAAPLSGSRRGLFWTYRHSANMLAYARANLSLNLERFFQSAPSQYNGETGSEDSNGNIAVLAVNFSTSDHVLFYGTAGNLTQVASGTGGGALQGWGVAAHAGKAVAFVNTKVYYYDGALYTHTAASVPKTILRSGDDLYLVLSNGVYKVEAAGLTQVVSETGLVGGASSPGGTIIYAKGNGEVYSYGIATSTATLLGTIPLSSPVIVRGFKGTGNLFVYAETGFSRKLYVYDPGTSSFVELDEPSAPPNFLGELPSGGGSGTELTTLNAIPLPPNTIVWTEPGIINLCTAYSYHTVVPRASSSITGLTSSPAGVLIAMENEVYLASGTFADIRTTRIAPYPAMVGHDREARWGQAGSTIFLVWGGRIYALEGGGATPISLPVDDGVPFVGVAYDGKRHHLVARKADGRVLRYDIPTKVWFNDMDGCLDIAESADGIYYLREVNGGRGVYALALKDGLPSENYYRMPQEIELSSVRMGPEPVKRLRAIYLHVKAEGAPPNPHVEVFNENGALVASGDMLPTLTSNAFGIARYHFRFPPVMTFASERIVISFNNANLILAPDLEVWYESRERRI